MDCFRLTLIQKINLHLRATLENLRDREAETSTNWKSLQENVFSWKGQIYEMYEAANAFDETVKVIAELCDKSENKETLAPEEIGAGDVIVQDIEQKLKGPFKNNGTVSSSKLNKLFLSRLKDDRQLGVLV